jgi:hypothetical protein
LNANPTWIGRDNNGNTQVGDGAGGYFTWASHEHPGVRQFLIDLMVEVVDRYDVDGIQFDRCRYPSTAFGYDPTTAAAYLAATGQNPPTNVNNSAWKRWRADRLIAFHQDFYTAVKARRATVRVTDAPTVWPGSYDNFLQDWPAWLVGGSLDLVYPQVYRTTTSAYITTLDQQLNAVPVALRSKVAPGIRAISGTATNDVLGMVAADRARNLPGHVFWYAEGLYDDLPALTANYFQAPAAIPQRPAGWRPPWAVREENDPTSTFTPGFFPSTAVGTSGGQARIALASASASERVGYSLQVANTGLWTLLAYVPTGVGLATTAPYRLTHAAGTAVLGVDQTAAQPAGWRELGTFWLDQGTAALEIGAMPGQVVMADAVALLRSRLPSGPMATIGVGTGGTLGGLRLSMAGRSGLGGAVVIQANRTPVGSPVVVGLALTGSLVPLFGGTLYVLPLATTGGVADGLGTFATTVGIPFSVSLLGTSLFAQGLALDAAAIDFVSLSAAVATTIQ